MPFIIFLFFQVALGAYLNVKFDVKESLFNPDGVERTILGPKVSSYRSDKPQVRDNIQAEWWKGVKTLRGPFGPIIEGKEGDTMIYRIVNNLPPTPLAAKRRALEGVMSTNQQPADEQSSARRRALHGKTGLRSLGGVTGKMLHSATGPSTSIHLHGLDNDYTNQYDGVAGITQCGVASGTQWLQKTKLAHQGTTWWHSHVQTQYTDGLMGPLIIQPLKSRFKVNQEVIVSLSDWWHIPAEEAYILSGNSSLWGPKGDPTNPDSILINGYGRYDCDLGVPEGMTCTPNAPYAEFKWKKGNKYLLRIVNQGTQTPYWFSIDGHKLQVIQADFTPVQPQTVDRIYIDVAQRYDVLVTANGPLDKYWMRVQVDQSPFFNRAPLLQNFTYGIVRYGSSKGDPVSQPPANPVTLNEMTLRPLVSKKAPSPLVQNIHLDFGFGTTSWVVNNQAFTLQPTPLLARVVDNGTIYPTDSTYILSARGKAVQFVIQSYDGWPHPWHIHGHEFAVLAIGSGYYQNNATLQLNNPIRRDVITIPANGYAVVRYNIDNPGVWLSHCHIAWHLEGGLAYTTTELPNELKKMKLDNAWWKACN